MNANEAQKSKNVRMNFNTVQQAQYAESVPSGVKIFSVVVRSQVDIPEFSFEHGVGKTKVVHRLKLDPGKVGLVGNKLDEEVGTVFDKLKKDKKDLLIIQVQHLANKNNTSDAESEWKMADIVAVADCEIRSSTDYPQDPAVVSLITYCATTDFQAMETKIFATLKELGNNLQTALIKSELLIHR